MSQETTTPPVLVDLEEIKAALAKYRQGVAGIRAEIEVTNEKLTRLRTEATATGGAVAVLERLVEQFTPKDVTPKDVTPAPAQ
jgi:hypothetical protein